MNNLILDCSSGMSVFVQKDNDVFSYADGSQKKHTDELLVTVDDLMTKAKLKISDIDNLVVCVGPGSFTGIRVAISIAKGFAVVNNFKVYSLSNFDIYDTKNSSKYALVLEGFSTFVYVKTFDGNIADEQCIRIEDFQDWAKQNGDYDIFVQTEKLQNLFKNTEIKSQIAQNNTIFAVNQIIQSKNNILLEQISPIYLRKSQAEIERLKKLNEEKND